MGKLIILEWKKNNTKKYILSASIMTACLFLLIFGINFWGMAVDPDTGMVDAPTGYNQISVFIDVLTHMCYICFCATMLAGYIVSTYKNKRMGLMFSYPISRKKILSSQMLAVWIFNFFATVLTKLFLYLAVQIQSQYQPSAFGLDFNFSSPAFYIQLTLSSAIIISISFVALFIGLVMNSSKATILASILLVCLTQGNIGSFTLANNLIFYAILLISSIFFAVLSVLRADSQDLM